SYQGGQLIVWNASTWQELYVLPTVGAPVAFSADGQLLGAVDADYAIEIREAATGRGIRELRGHGWIIWDITFNPNGDMPWLTSGSAEGTVRIWDVRNGKEITGLPIFAASTVALGASPREVRAFSAAALLTARTLTIAPPLRHTNGVLAVAFSQDG